MPIEITCSVLLMVWLEMILSKIDKTANLHIYIYRIKPDHRLQDL